MVEPLVAGIDIGTTKVAALIGLVEGERVSVVGAGLARSQGVEKGIVADPLALGERVAEAAEAAERSCGRRIARAFVSIGGSHIHCRNARGQAQVAHPLRGVEPEDIQRAMAEASAMAMPPERQILHVCPRGFWLDDSVYVRDPIGVAAYELAVEVHMVTALRSSVRNTTRAVEDCGIEVAGLVSQALASAEAVLTDEEKELGVALLDIGGGTTDLAVYLNSGVWYSCVLPIGGNHITGDLAVALHCPLEVAEDIKLRLGTCAAAVAAEGERVRVPGFGANTTFVQRAEIAAVIRARVAEIFSMALRELKRSGLDNLLVAGVVLCGGTANLPGIAELGEEVLNLPVRVARPSRAEGLAWVVNEAAQATGVGLLVWAAREVRRMPPVPRRRLWQRFERALRSLLPGEVGR